MPVTGGTVLLAGGTLVDADTGVFAVVADGVVIVMGFPICPIDVDVVSDLCVVEFPQAVMANEDNTHTPTLDISFRLIILTY